MKLNVELPDDVLVISKNDLKELLEELISDVKGNNSSNKFLTIKETAQMLDVSVPTVRKLIERNEIPYIKSGQIIRINKVEVIKWTKNIAK